MGWESKELLRLVVQVWVFDDVKMLAGQVNSLPLCHLGSPTPILVVLNQGHCDLQGTSGIVLRLAGCHFWVKREVPLGILKTFNVLGPEMVLNILQCAGQPPTTKNYLAQNVNMAEVGNP